MFDRSTVKQYRDLINAVLTPLGEKLGVSISVGKASFTSDNIQFKLEVARKSEDGRVINKDVESFLAYAGRYGLKKEDLNRVFTLQGVQYEIIGCRPRNWKNPIIVKRVSDGFVFKMDHNTVHWALT